LSSVCANRVLEPSACHLYCALGYWRCTLVIHCVLCFVRSVCCVFHPSSALVVTHVSFLMSVAVSCSGGSSPVVRLRRRHDSSVGHSLWQLHRSTGGPHRVGAVPRDVRHRERRRGGDCGACYPFPSQACRIPLTLPRVLCVELCLCGVVSCCVVSCRVVSCRVVSCRVVSCRVVSCRVVSRCLVRADSVRMERVGRRYGAGMGRQRLAPLLPSRVRWQQSERPRAHGRRGVVVRPRERPAHLEHAHDAR
jgi:hypothetical protein